jgi:RNA polymerase sigma-70 factor (ECF subfamily)
LIEPLDRDPRVDGRPRGGRAVERALADLVSAHSDAVYRLARSIVHDSALADDVVQETMVKAWRALPDFDGEIPRAWLMRVAHNTAISLLRTRRDQVRDASDFGEVAERAAGPATTTVDRAALDELWHALAELDETSRSLVVMREMSGLSYEEIAEALDLPLATVKTRLFRARRRLQAAMEEWRG